MEIFISFPNHVLLSPPSSVMANDEMRSKKKCFYLKLISQTFVSLFFLSPTTRRSISILLLLRCLHKAFYTRFRVFSIYHVVQFG